jgi:flagellar hook-basal body complex protein FliE
MSFIPNIAAKAYKANLESGPANTVAGAAAKQEAPGKTFMDTMKKSVADVNDMQVENKAMVKEFATGEKQNVHELMISMQKAGVAMRMTSAVRNKVMESYRELLRIQF